LSAWLRAGRQAWKVRSYACGDQDLSNRPSRRSLRKSFTEGNALLVEGDRVFSPEKEAPSERGVVPYHILFLLKIGRRDILPAYRLQILYYPILDSLFSVINLIFPNPLFLLSPLSFLSVLEYPPLLCHRKLERLGSVHDKAPPFGLGHDSPCHEHIAHGSFQHVFGPFTSTLFILTLNYKKTFPPTSPNSSPP